MTFLRLLLPSTAKILMLVALLFPPSLGAQIFDDFSDGDFTQNPTWVGDVSNFVVNAFGELQLNAPEAGSSMLAVQGNIPDNAEWNLRFRLDFSPSNSNLLRIYLQADQPNLTTANGYFIEIGETGSLDALRLFRQSGATKTLLASGIPGFVATNPDVRLRVTRTSTGVWEATAAAGTSAFEPQFTATDATHDGGANRFFGFQCVYTVTNRTRFFFDDIAIANGPPDTMPPVLLLANADDAQTVRAVFDEKLDSASALDPARYTVSSGVGQPVSVVFGNNQKTVLLSLPNALPNGSHTLQVSGMKDVFGNTSMTQTADFQFLKIDVAIEFDILINEIMADPSPSAGLPEVEWFELFNRSNKTFDLAALRVQDATSSPVSLPSFILNPGEYVVLTANANAATLQAVSAGPVLGISISASLLNNDGDVLTLTRQNGEVIDRVDYSVTWHTITAKRDGGWSLERINPNLPCLNAENWQSCPVAPGGTPGAQNASFQNTPDMEAPRLLSAFPESATSLLLVFSEGLDKNAAQDPGAYRIEPLLDIASAGVLPDDRSRTRLTLTTPLQPGIIYEVSAEADVLDCSGNAAVTDNAMRVGLPEKPAPQDIVVNEMMFNPGTGNSRYIEFYNRSEKIFDWSEFVIANFARATGTITTPIAQKRLFFPGQYDVFTPNPDNVRGVFSNINSENVLQNTLPSFDNNSGNVTLFWSKAGETVHIDSFNYTRDWHNALLTISQRTGVALERIDTEALTNQASNWTSASSVVTGAPGTPTLPNSQQRPAPPVGNDWIQIPRARLSPDGDSYEDFLEVFYALPREGFFATTTIFDSEGIPVKRLVRQELLGTEGTLRWDGDLDDGTRAKPGIYVLFVELFAPDGTTERTKKAIAVVARF